MEIKFQAIFDWVFGAGPASIGGTPNFTYLATPDAALTLDAVAARAEREAASATNVREKLAPTSPNAGGGPRISGHEARPLRRPGPRGPREPAAGDRVRRAPPRVLRRRRAAPRSAWRARLLGFAVGALAAMLTRG